HHRHRSLPQEDRPEAAGAHHPGGRDDGHARLPRPRAVAGRSRPPPGRCLPAPAGPLPADRPPGAPPPPPPPPAGAHPPPPTTPPLRSVRPEIPDSVARLVDRCVRREPSERYASAEALVAEIEDVKTVFLPHTGTEAPVALERDAVAVAGSFARVAPHLDRFT